MVKLPKAAERSQPPFTARIMAADVMLAMMARLFAIDVRQPKEISPIGSMYGMYLVIVYDLPTFTIEINHSCR